MDMVDYGRFALAFVFVIVLIYAIGWVAKKVGLQQRLQGIKSSRGQIEIIDSLMIDPRRRLVLIKHAGKEHLVLLGPQQDTVIDSHDPSATTPHDA